MKKLKQKRGKRAWWPKLLIALPVLFLLLAIGGYVWIMSYLRGDSFRVRLEQEAKQHLSAQSVEIDSLRWDGWSVEAPRVNIELPVHQENSLKLIEVKRLQTEFDPSGLRKQTIRLLESNVGHIHLQFQNSSAPPPHSSETAYHTETETKTEEKQNFQQAESEASWWMPNQFETGKSTVDRFSGQWLHEAGWEVVSWDDVRLSLEQDPAQQEAYLLEVQGGSANAKPNWIPELRIKNATAQLSPDRIVVQEANLGLLQNARLAIQGEQERNQGYQFDAQLENLNLKEILPESWKDKVRALVEAEFSLDSKPEQSLVIEGSLNMESAFLTDLEFQDILARYTGDFRLERLFFQQAQANFRFQNEELTLSEIHLESPALVSLKGSLYISATDELEGDFQLGFAPGVLSKIPGAESQVFVRVEDGLRWAPLKLSGTLARPKEDLSTRLIAAAGARIQEIGLETAQKTLKQGVEIIKPAVPLAEEMIQNQNPASFVDQLLEGGGDAAAPLVEAGGNLLEQGLDAIGEHGSDLIDQGNEAIDNLLRFPFAPRSED